MPIGGRIPDLEHVFTHDGEAVWPKELAVSALHYTGNCEGEGKGGGAAMQICSK